MSDKRVGLFKEVLLSHGAESFGKYRFLRAKLVFGGTAWDASHCAGILPESVFELDLRDGKTIIDPFETPGVRSVFTPNSVTIEDAKAGTTETRYHPVFSYQNETHGDPWDNFQTAYISSYSMRSVAGAPFVFDSPAFLTEEVPHKQIHGSKLRCFRVTFPARSGFHPGQQLNYVGEDGLICRQDYMLDSLGTMPVICIPSSYEDFGGVKLPTTRRIFNFSEQFDGSGEPVFSTQLLTAEFE